MKMKIGFDAKRAFHNFRGLGNYSRNLLRGLLTFFPENDYFFFTPPPPPPPPTARTHASTHASTHIGTRFQKELEGRHGVTLMTPSALAARLGLGAWWRTFALSREIRKCHLHLYHGLSHELPRGIEESGAASIVTIHDLIFMRFPEFFPWIDRQIYGQKVRHSCQKAHQIIAICEQTKRDLIGQLHIPASKIKVIYQSCAPHFYERCSPIERRRVSEKYSLPASYLLYVGALEERKNLLTLVRAHARLAHQIPLVLVGAGKKYRTRLLEEIKKQGTAKGVFLLGHVPEEDLAALYQGAALFVYPSLFEGFGIPIIQAGFSGVPVVTSQGSCFPEVAGEHSLYVDPRSQEELSAAMERVLGDRILAERMGGEGLNFAQRFHYENTTKMLMNCYGEVLRGGRESR